MADGAGWRPQSRVWSHDGEQGADRAQPSKKYVRNLLKIFANVYTVRYEVTYPVCCAGFAAGHEVMQCETQVDGHIFR